MIVVGSESENGWRPAKVSQDQCEWVLVPGTNVHLQLMKGIPSTIMRAYAADYNAYVEKLRDPDSAGWTPTNSVATSNHLNGTAMDLNWDTHPFRIADAGYTPEMKSTMAEILDFYEGTMFWANNWTDPKDAMHHQMGYDTWNNQEKCKDFIRRKIRSDGYSTFRRGVAVPKQTTVLAAAQDRVLNYDRNIVGQETGYWCGPASTQIVLSARGVRVSEAELASIIGTTVNGTDYIGQIEKRALDKYLPEAGYATVDLPNDPPTQEQTDLFWDRLRGAVDAGYGLVMNWVAPASNAPVGIKGSVSPSGYGNHTIWHYVTAMGYSESDMAVWVADPGFRPFGYWITLRQCMTLMPPKGYTYPANVPARTAVSRPAVSQPDQTRIPATLPVGEVAVNNGRFQSRSIYRSNNDRFMTVEDAVANIDGMCHAGLIVEPAALRGELWAIDMVAKLASGRSAGAKTWFDPNQDDTWAVSRAQAILAVIERTRPDALTAYIQQRSIVT